MFPGNDPSRGSPPPRQRQRTRQRNAPPAPPAPTYYAPPVSSSSSGQYSSNSGGGGTPRNNPSFQQSQGPIHKPGRSPGPSQAVANLAPSTGKFLHNDSQYQSDISALQAEIENFVRSNQQEGGQVRGDFRTAMNRMGTERTRSLGEIQADFAARGLLNSTEYLNANEKYNNDYQNKTFDLQHDRGSNISRLKEERRNYRTSNIGERVNARQEAIRRRAEQYGLKL